LARLLDEYPDVFDAWRALVVGGLAARNGAKGESFQHRRERTRAQRIARL